MKKIILYLLICLSGSIFAQLGIGTITPDAQLDVRASNQANPSNRDGIIIPRIDIFPTNNPTATQNGMLVFLTTASAEYPIGFYYWNNNLSIWKKVDMGNVKYWEKSGNSGTTNGTDFIGTVDAQDLDIRVNNIIHTRITQKGQIETLNTGQSVFIGEEAGKDDDLNLNQNVYVGFNTGYHNLYNRYVTAFGYCALYNNNHGNYNTANGFYTLRNNDGGNNTATGFQAIYENQGGNYNTVVGRQMLYNLDSNYNTSVGYPGGSYNFQNSMDYTTRLGYINPFISSIAFKENSLYIGNNIDCLPNENAISIGNSLMVGDFSIPFDNSNKVGISIRDPKERVDINGAIILQSTSNTNAGTIRWSGTDFEGYDGTRWLSLTKHNNLWNNNTHESTENQMVMASDGVAGDLFGYSVAISGDYAIIGAFRDRISGNNYQGAAYIFRKDGNSWIEEDKLIASDGAASDLFGYSVAISGDYAIVGSYLDDVYTSNQGSAYIFKRTGSSWNQEAKIIASDWGGNDQFGYSVSISGSYAAVGVPRKSIAGNNNQGAAYIFKRDGSNWNQEAKITASDGETSDYFGASISISGDYTVVGAYYDDVDANNDQGSAYIFKRNGTAWNQESKLIASDGITDNYFGIAVSIYDSYALVGASRADADKGAAYIFKRDGTIWTQESKLTATDGDTYDNFGVSVSIYDNCAIIGASQDDTTTISNRGSTYVFMKTDTTWSEKVKLMASDGEVNDFFGCSVAIFGENIIIGAYGAEKAYFFNK